MVKNPPLIFLSLLLLVLVFVAVAFDAVPPSRSQSLLIEEEVFHDLHAEGVNENRDDTELLQAEGLAERRLDIETTDYPGTGANNHHDPRTPGGV